MRLTPGRRPRPARRRTAPAAVLILVALVAMLLPAVAAAEPADLSAQDPTSDEEKVAEQALDAVQEALQEDVPVPHEPEHAGEAGRELTLLLRDLYLAKDALEGEDARAAARIFARPTSDDNDCGPREPGAGTPFCVHWMTSGADAPPLTDADGNGIPDQVDDTRDALARSWQVTVTEGGYRAPLLDTGGPDERFDVYLSDLGASGLYGYCLGTGKAAGQETPGTKTTAAYCELDDDYRQQQFPAQTPLKNLQVTAAHEFFHAVQFAYDAAEDAWMLEGTAAWIEDEVYDAIDDNRQYLADSPLSTPWRPLDRTQAGLSIYGSWIWWRHLTETHPDRAGTSLPVLMREIWEKAAKPTGPYGVWSVPAIEAALDKRDTDLPTTFAAFAAANRAPALAYEEGAAYRPSPTSGKWRLRGNRPRSGTQSVTLPHLSSSTFVFRRGSALGERRRLRVVVDMPDLATEPRAVLTVVRQGGARRTKPVDLDPQGDGRRVVGFANKVRSVELTVVNAGHEYRCEQGTGWACSGTPLSDDRRTTFKAVARR